MVSDIDKIDWNHKLYDKNTEEQWKTFKEVIEQLDEKWVPTIKIRQNRKASIPLKKEEIEAVRRKHKHWKIYMKSRDDKDYREFCKARNKVKKMIRKKTRDFENSTIMDIKKNPKQAWRYIKSKYKSKDNVKPLLTD